MSAHRFVALVGLALTLLFALVAASEAAVPAEVAKLTASDDQIRSGFGGSVAVSGDTAVVGADGIQGGFAGAVYVFQRDEGGADNWGELTKLIASDVQEEPDRFGVSVAMSGDTLVVGAGLAGTPGREEGAVYVFQRNEGGADNWGEVKKLAAPGWNGAVRNDTIVEGAAYVSERDEGGAHVFQRDEGGTDNWGEVKILTSPDVGEFSSLGGAVAADEDTVAVAEGDGTQAVHIYERDAGGEDNWGEVKRLTDSLDAGDRGRFGGRFGDIVSVSGDTAVINGIQVGDESLGAAYVFERDEGGTDNWGEVTKLTGSDTETQHGFGFSVALSGETAVVGTFSARAAYVFSRAGPPDPPEPTEPPDEPAAPAEEEAETPETPDSSGLNAGLLAGIVAGVAAGAVALGGVVWYVRRRRQEPQ